MDPDRLDRLARQLGHSFRDPELLDRALTHRSAAAAHNERLEFLGDGILNFVVGHLLYERHPDATEGELTYARARLVRQEELARIAERLGLGDDLVLGDAQRRSGVFRRESVLADAMEAVLGAVFLDGGYAAVRDVCDRLFGEALAEPPDPARLKDPKTRLQEFLQGQGRPLPLYEVDATSGPAHHQRFSVTCRLADGPETTDGEAGSRKAAEQVAAERMLEQLHA